MSFILNASSQGYAKVSDGLVFERRKFFNFLADADKFFVFECNWYADVAHDSFVCFSAASLFVLNHAANHSAQESVGHSADERSFVWLSCLKDAVEVFQADCSWVSAHDCFL